MASGLQRLIGGRQPAAKRREVRDVSSSIRTKMNEEDEL